MLTSFKVKKLTIKKSKRVHNENRIEFVSEN